ncbi:MAG: DUF4169 family protein [Siculibacillus sp.]|nr:DUF4169 family protein [Siculibacillus sp.]
MGEVIGLGRFRKARARADDKKRAEENRLRFGRTRAERDAAEMQSDLAARRLDAHRLAPGAADDTPEA